MRYVLELRQGFPKTEMAALATRSIFADVDEMLSEIGQRSRVAGFYTRADFIIMCELVTDGKHCGDNSAQYIERFTRICLSSTAERDRIRSLKHLSGVSWNAAAVILHYTFDNEYPTLAHGVLWSWGFDRKPRLNFEFWLAYVKASRAICSECRVTMRTLDLALQQYAIEQVL